MSYRLAEVGVIRIVDGAAITRDMPEWEDYRQWLRDGGTPEPMQEVVAPRWPSLDAAMLDAWATTKLRRDKLEQSGFPYMGQVLDSDPRSVQRINTAVQAAQAAAMAGLPFQIGWTCADGSVLELDAVGMVGAPAALAMYANTLHIEARAFRARINAATDMAEIEAILLEVEAWI